MGSTSDGNAPWWLWILVWGGAITSLLCFCYLGEGTFGVLAGMVAGCLAGGFGIFAPLLYGGGWHGGDELGTVFAICLGGAFIGTLGGLARSPPRASSPPISGSNDPARRHPFAP
jgi:hypothetical protein